MTLEMWIERRVAVERFQRATRLELSLVQNGRRIDFDLARVTHVVERVAFWHQANAIHGWFVRNVRQNRDDRGTYPLEREALVQLVERCDSALAQPEHAKLFLPTRDPVLCQSEIFGSSHYDRRYWAGVEYTKRACSTVLDMMAADESDRFFYVSRWNEPVVPVLHPDRGHP